MTRQDLTRILFRISLVSQSETWRGAREGRGSFKVLSSHHQSRTMGAGASTEARQTAVSMLLNKPEDASDITDVETAKSEIIALRKFAKNFQDQLRSK